MSDIDTGGPAFPNVPNGAGDKWDSWDMGMTLRDYFAAKAMQSLVARWGSASGNPSKVAYDITDAMLEARKS